MRNAVFYTKIPLDMEKCLSHIKKTYKGAHGTNILISLGKPPKSLHIWLPSANLGDPLEAADMSEDIDKIPFDNPYFTHVDFHKMSTLQNVVKAISVLYPEMIIWTDNDIFYTNEKFLNTQFVD